MSAPARESWAKLAVLGDEVEARLLAGQLAEAEIESEIEKAPALGDFLYGSGGNPRAPVTVWVPADELEAAEAVRDELLGLSPWAREPVGPPRPLAFERWSSLRWWIAAAVAVSMLAGALVGLRSALAS